MNEETKHVDSVHVILMNAHVIAVKMLIWINTSVMK